MSSEHFFLPPARPEWQRSGRFFLIALALHAAVLFYPLKLAVGKLEIPSAATVMVRLVEAVSTPSIKPLKAPTPPAQPTPKHEKPAVTPQPVLAVSPQPNVSPSSIAPAVANPAPVATAPAAAVTNAAPVASAAPSVSAARYDAAYLQNPRPNYPPLSRRLGEEGKVLLKVRVSAEGVAAAVDVEKSSNFVRLDEAARLAVTRWRFVPAKRGDEAIEASVIVPLVFRLDD